MAGIVAMPGSVTGVSGLDVLADHSDTDAASSLGASSPAAHSPHTRVRLLVRQAEAGRRHQQQQQRQKLSPRLRPGGAQESSAVYSASSVASASASASASPASSEDGGGGGGDGAGDYSTNEGEGDDGERFAFVYSSGASVGVDRDSPYSLRRGDTASPPASLVPPGVTPIAHRRDSSVSSTSQRTSSNHPALRDAHAASASAASASIEYDFFDVTDAVAVARQQSQQRQQELYPSQPLPHPPPMPPRVYSMDEEEEEEEASVATAGEEGRRRVVAVVEAEEASDNNDEDSNAAAAATAPAPAANVWERLTEHGDVQARNREARHLLHCHHKQLAEEATVRIPKVVLSKPWRPSRRPRRGPDDAEGVAAAAAAADASRGSGSYSTLEASPLRAPPDPRYPFKPTLGRETQHLAGGGSGKDVWGQLHKHHSCDCTPQKEEEPLPEVKKIGSGAAGELCDRLYGEAFKEKLEKVTYRKKPFPFHPQIAPRSALMTKNRVTPFSERLTTSRSPPRTGLSRRSGALQRMEVCTSGVSVRAEPRDTSERVCVLTRGDVVGVAVDSIVHRGSEMWAETQQGWCQLVAACGTRCLVPCYDKTPLRTASPSAARQRAASPLRVLGGSRGGRSPSPRRSGGVGGGAAAAAATPTKARRSVMSKREALEKEINRLSYAF